MMMHAAGGPALSNPVLANPIALEPARAGLSPVAWTAVGLAVLAHAGLGLVLYNQRFEPPPLPLVHEPPVIEIDFTRPPPRPPEPQAPAAAPTPPIHRTPPASTPVESLVVNLPEVPTAPVAGTVINLVQPVTDPAAQGTASTAAETVPASPPVITNPDWVRRPDAEALMRAYPRQALAAGVSGSATLSCEVRVNGTLSGCTVQNESPGGYGFGRAATRLSRDFRMSPRTVDGQAVGGGRVSIAIRFTLPTD